MERTHLKALMAVIEEGSVYKAAGRVGSAEPDVTLAIRQLEQEVGTPLIQFSPVRLCRPTTAGELLYHHARNLFSPKEEPGKPDSDFEKVEFWNWPPML